MSGGIHLIVEDQTDAEVVRAMLKARKIRVQVHPLIPTGASGGVSRLARQLEQLIQTALRKRQTGDCIAVLNDADEMSETNRSSHNQIKATCRKYPRDVVLIVASDEIEAWLLADEGLCRWLSENPRNASTNERKPSERLERAVKNKTGKKYSGRTRAQVLEKLDGTGERYNRSLQKALTHLHNAPCVRENQ